MTKKSNYKYVLPVRVSGDQYEIIDSAGNYCWDEHPEVRLVQIETAIANDQCILIEDGYAA